ncbi:MAG: TauD/TfdA family dioxygenase [Deltaproteobacteria bacterium]
MVSEIIGNNDFTAAFIDDKTTLPLVLTSKNDNLTLAKFFSLHKEPIDQSLLKYGGILFRNFNLEGIEEFEGIVGENYGSLLEYNDRATPRSQVKGKVYTATDYPPEQEILLHNESSFAARFPGKIFFYCVTASEEGGETPLADVRKVYKRLDPSIRKPFEEKGVLYVRNFSGGPFGFSWQEVYQTQDKSEMERFCRESDIEYEWIDNNKVRTRQLRPAIAKHPVSGEFVWLNHATVLSVFAIEPKLQQMLLKFFKEKDLPNNTYYGDGSSIDKETITKLREAYDTETVSFPWERGDVLMLDNMIVAHGRRPYSGSRKIVVAMANPTTWKELETSI